MKSADALAREHTEKAISLLAQVVDDTDAEYKDRIKAADSILDRGHGKPNQAIIQIPANRAMAALLAGKSDEELLALLNSHQLPRLAPIEAEFSEIDKTEDDLLR